MHTRRDACGGDAAVRVGTTTEKRPCLRRTRTSYYELLHISYYTERPASEVGIFFKFFFNETMFFFAKSSRPRRSLGFRSRSLARIRLDPPADNATRAPARAVCVRHRRLRWRRVRRLCRRLKGWIETDTFDIRVRKQQRFLGRRPRRRRSRSK